MPLTTPFKADESIDHEALAKQVVRLAQAGVGIVLLGTNGEGRSFLVKPWFISLTLQHLTCRRRSERLLCRRRVRRSTLRASPTSR